MRRSAAPAWLSTTGPPQTLKAMANGIGHGALCRFFRLNICSRLVFVRRPGSSEPASVVSISARKRRSRAKTPSRPSPNTANRRMTQKRDSLCAARQRAEWPACGYISPDQTERSANGTGSALIQQQSEVSAQETGIFQGMTDPHATEFEKLESYFLVRSI